MPHATPSHVLCLSAHQCEHQVVEGCGRQKKDQDGEEQSPDEQLQGERTPPSASAKAPCQGQPQRHEPHVRGHPHQTHPTTEQKRRARQQDTWASRDDSGKPAHDSFLQDREGRFCMPPTLSDTRGDRTSHQGVSTSTKGGRAGNSRQEKHALRAAHRDQLVRPGLSMLRESQSRALCMGHVHAPPSRSSLGPSTLLTPGSTSHWGNVLHCVRVPRPLQSPHVPQAPR